MNITELGVAPNTGVDQTAALQTAINLSRGELDFPTGVYLHSGGLIGHDNIALVSKSRGAILRNTANTASFDFSGKKNWFVGDGLSLEGTAAAWPGQVDLGQKGVLADGCSDYMIRGAAFRYFSGSAIEHKNSVQWWDRNIISDTELTGNYRGVYAWSYGQFLKLSGLNVHDNLWGLLLDTGNQEIRGGTYTRNSTAIQFRGGLNNGHSTITGAIIDHNGYALSLINLDAGLVVTGTQMMCDVTNAIAAGAIQIYNSHYILIANCHLAVNFLFDGTDLGPPSYPVTGNRNGLNRVAGNCMRTDILGMGAPVIQNGATTPQLKDNFTASGPWAYNN